MIGWMKHHLGRWSVEEIAAAVLAACVVALIALNPAAVSSRFGGSADDEVAPASSFPRASPDVTYDPSRTATPPGVIVLHETGRSAEVMIVMPSCLEAVWTVVRTGGRTTVGCEYAVAAR